MNEFIHSVHRAAPIVATVVLLLVASTSTNAQWRLEHVDECPATDIRSIAILGTDTIFVAAFDRGVWCSRDGGTTWEDLLYPGTEENLFITAFSLDRSYVTVAGSSIGSVFRFDIDNWIWEEVGAPRPDQGVGLCMSSPTGWLFVVSLWDLYRTRVDTVEWTGLRKGLYYVKRLRSIDDAVYALVVPTTLRSMDDGETWDTVGPAGRAILDMTEHRDQIVAACDTGFARSTDAGTTWSYWGADLYFGSRELRSSPNGDLFLTGSSGLCRSTDDGSSWSIENEGLEVPWMADALAIDSAGCVYVGTHRYGLFRRVSTTSVSQGQPESPSALSITPLPSQGEATIRVDSRAVGLMTLVVYDVLGAVRHSASWHHGGSVSHESVRGLAPGHYTVHVVGAGLAAPLVAPLVIVR